MTFSDIQYAFGAASYLGFLGFFTFVSLVILREKHSAEIYLIWYINSFFFLVFFVLEFVSFGKYAFVSQVCGSYEATCKTIYEYLTDTKGEIEIVVILTSLAVLPQLLAYLLSGVSGTATAPKFVQQIQTLAVWSLVKFFAGLGGILTGEFFGRLTWQLTNISLAPLPEIKELVVAFFFTMSAFVTAAFHVFFSENWPEWRERYDGWFRPFARLHQFLTRYDRER